MPKIELSHDYDYVGIKINPLTIIDFTFVMMIMLKNSVNNNADHAWKESDSC